MPRCRLQPRWARTRCARAGVHGTVQPCSRIYMNRKSAKRRSLLLLRPNISYCARTFHIGHITSFERSRCQDSVRLIKRGQTCSPRNSGRAQSRPSEYVGKRKMKASLRFCMNQVQCYFHEYFIKSWGRCVYALLRIQKYKNLVTNCTINF